MYRSCAPAASVSHHLPCPKHSHILSRSSSLKAGRPQSPQASFSSYKAHQKGCCQLLQGRKGVVAQAGGAADPSKIPNPEDAARARDEEKLEKINAGQYLFYKVKEQAERKVERVLNRARTKYLEEEKKTLYNEDAEQYQSTKLIINSPIMLLKHSVWTVIMLVLRLPITFFMRALIAVDTWWREKFSPTQFEFFLMSEGEKIWGWKNRTENERWFWQYLFFRVLLPTVGGIFTYEAFVPNNILWAVVVPYLFYWGQYGIVLGPWILDWWLVMYLGLYTKCWPDVVACLQWLMFIR